MFLSFHRFCSVEIKRATPFLACAAAGFVVSLYSATPAVAQTTMPSDPSEMRYATAAARMSAVYNTNGLSTYSILKGETGTGLWRKNNYAESLECWTTQSTLHSNFNAITESQVRNDTANEVFVSGYPYANIFATGMVGYSIGTHDAFSSMGLGDDGFAAGETDTSNGVYDYVKDSVHVFVKSSYQPGEFRKDAGTTQGSADSTLPPSPVI